MSTPVPISASANNQIYVYFGSLTLLVYLALPDGYLLDIATSFMLKNQLHATAIEVSRFRLLTAIPVILSFAFGLARDHWSPLGLRDRGFFLIFAPLGTIALLWMAYAPLSYGVLVIGMLLLMLSFRFISAAYQGLLALIGQQQKMSGRLSALYHAGSFFCYVAGALGAGYVTTYFAPRQTFVLAGVLTFLIALIGVWKPKAIFSPSYEAAPAEKANFLSNIKRLVKHRPIYPAILVVFLYQFTPSTSTPLQFYLTNDLHGSDTAYANYTALNLLAYLPIFGLYGYLCKRLALKRLLLWGTLMAIPATFPIIFLHSADAVVKLAVFSGLACGVGQAATVDLAMRSCPRGLQGTLMSLIIGVWTLAFRGSDLFGSWIYGWDAKYGYTYCVFAAVATTALVLPVLLFVPDGITSSADGEVIPTNEMHTEVAGATVAH